MYQKDQQQVENRFREYWAMENHDRPIMCVYAQYPVDTPLPYRFSSSPEEHYLDPHIVIHNFRLYMEHTYYAGEAFPFYWPNVGTDIVAGLAGCRLKYAFDTVWALPYVEDWDALPPFRFDPSNFYYQKALDLVKAAIKDSGGEYIIGNTDLHAGLDGLSALRGSEPLCFDYIEQREKLKPRLEQLFDLATALYDGLDEIIKSSGQKGTCSWFNILHPDKRWYPTSCDVACMISPDDYEDLVIPNLMRELDFYDASLYHLDGVVNLHHLDRLLRIPQLDGIQWVPGDGKPTMRHWVDVMRKIQAAGKRLSVVADEPEDLVAICENLEPEGVHISMHVPSPEAADEMIRLAEDIYTAKRARVF